MELINALLDYFSQIETQQAVLLPAFFTALALSYIPQQERQPFFMLLVFSTVMSYMGSHWHITDDDCRQLFIMPFAFFSVSVMLWARVPVSAATAYAVTFLSMWTVDMAMATQLVQSQEVTWLSFFFGVGGAGYRDGLALLPIVSAALVHYANWRQRPRTPLVHHPLPQVA